MTTTAAIESMNNYQARAFRNFLDHVTFHDRYEVKELNVTDCYGDALVSIEVGLNGDEGTMAEVFCRDSYSFFIGKRGGIFQYEGTTKTYRKPYEVKAI